jgi:adenosine deaminase
LEHKQLSAGLIFCIAREYDVEQNIKIIDKAIKYRGRGVVAIDVAGPGREGFDLTAYVDAFERARQAGLHITIHSGEARDANDMWDALALNPSRIGHGVLAAYDEPLMLELAKRGTVLEVCPLSNLATKAVKDLEEMRFILRTFIDRGVRFCINTDWPEVIENGHLRNQYQLLLENNILTADELRACTQTAFESSFVPAGGGLEAYL